MQTRLRESQSEQDKNFKKLNCCCDSRSYCIRRTVYWQTIKLVSVTSLGTAGTHDPIRG